MNQKSLNLRDECYQTIIGIGKIAFFKDSPVILPYSYLILMVLVILDTIKKLIFFPFEVAIVSILLSPFLYTYIIYKLFNWFNKPERFLKTMLALLGTELFISVLANLLTMSKTKEINFDLLLVVIGLSLWSFAIAVSILKKSLDLKLSQAILGVLTLHLIKTVPLLILFKGPAAG